MRDGHFTTLRETELRAGEENLLETVYLDGKIMREQTFADIRARAAGAG
jgi:hypothetical protein